MVKVIICLEQEILGQLLFVTVTLILVCVPTNYDYTQSKFDAQHPMGVLACSLLPSFTLLLQRHPTRTDYKCNIFCPRMLSLSYLVGGD